MTDLEEKIARVIDLYEGLRAENAALQSQLAEARQTCDQYGNKLDTARARLEALASKLPPA